MAWITDQKLARLQDQGGSWVTDQAGEPVALGAATVEDELQRRLRVGAAEIALSDTNLYSVMNYVQRTINYATERIVATGTLTMTSGLTLHYTSTDIAADCYKVLSVYESSRSVMKLGNWNQFVQYDRDWHRSTGSRAEAWAHVGHNMIAVYPGTSGNLNAVYLQETTTIDSSGDDFKLPDIDSDLIYDLCEVVLLAHLKLVPEAGNKVKKLQKDIAPYVGGQV